MSSNEHDLKMPSFGSDMRKGTLNEWLVKEGQSIKRGDVVAVIETSKGAIELDVFEDAVVLSLLVKEGEDIAVGEAIARLSSTTKKADNHGELTNNQPTVSTQPVPATSRVLPATKGFVLATPAARLLAKKKNIYLLPIFAQNNNKIVTLAMVEQACKEDATDKIEVKNKHLGSEGNEELREKTGFDKQAMRQAISETVTRSKQQIPHYYLSQRLDVTALEVHLQSYNNNAPIEQRLLLAAPLLCAIARTLKKNKQLNGEYIEGQFHAQEEVHLANAINLRGGGLIMPVIRDAQKLTAQLMMQELKQQVSQVRNANLVFSQLSGGSCTVSSIGERGAEQMFAVIYPPQVAIIALGSPYQEVLVIDGTMQIRSVIHASLAADHRVSDGHIGARFLYQLNQLLQSPENLWQAGS